jgi:GNAT superfamily N-acetyltransferase
VSVPIRDVGTGDLEEFVLLWCAYLEEGYLAGGSIRPTSRTLAFYRELCRRYVLGRLDGVALLAQAPEAPRPEGVLLWGEGLSPSPLDLRYHRAAQGWGTYVRPARRGQGWSTELRTLAVGRLRAMGFDAVLGAASTRNPHGLETGLHFGFRIIEQVGVLSLVNPERPDPDRE